MATATRHGSAAIDGRTLEISITRDRALLRRFLEQDRLRAAYAICDLEEREFARSKWGIATRSGEPIAVVLEYGGPMNEQYLVHAALVGDRQWEVVLALSALAREHNERFFRVVSSIREPIAGLPHLPTWLPSAFWIRRKPAGS